MASGGLGDLGILQDPESRVTLVDESKQSHPGHPSGDGSNIADRLLGVNLSP
jgi:hypothetical protein